MSGQIDQLPRAVVMDFDGVILDSTDVKTAAFRELFSDWPDHVDDIVAYHLAHAGESRYRKFEHIYTRILGRPISQQESTRLGARFSELTLSRLLSCAVIDGAIEFVRATRQRAVPVFVASGTPETELREIVAQRSMSDVFTAAYGSPSTKFEIIGEIARQNGCTGASILMIGDAMTDLQEADRADAPFLGFCRSDDRLFPARTPVLAGFRGMTVAHCWALALRGSEVRADGERSPARAFGAR